ncbi:hypothetical protein [Paraliobacillus salinarum]|uniref:hypothetical protein n=1 Tax=Paraliobacillus salinarum TaxID=1158996 RepID=UPI0015F3BBE6|nr:hypothetical protein [Paraliobacillus salinarum]
MLEVFTILGVGVSMFFIFRFFREFSGKSIHLDLDKRYIEWSDHIAAAEEKLQKQGREVTYLGDGSFIIDGKYYIMIDWNIGKRDEILQPAAQRTWFKYDEERNKQAK